MTVLAVSPHLDDAAFSAGGTLHALARAGHTVVVATVFTRSVAGPTGFALRCQTDKGVPPDADYLAVRRAEDAAASARLGAEPVWLDLPEAPHRGYTSPEALFAGIHAGDARTWHDVLGALRTLAGVRRPGLVLSCAGLGGHVDHLHTARAVASLAEESGVPAAWWRDAPYAFRQPEAPPAQGLPCSLAAVPLAAADLAARLDACAAYATQLPYQFGRDRPDASPEAAMRDAVARFARAEGAGLGGPAERFFADAPARHVLRFHAAALP